MGGVFGGGAEFLAAGVGFVDLPVRSPRGRAGGHDDDAVRQEDAFEDRMGDEDHRAADLGLHLQKVVVEFVKRVISSSAAKGSSIRISAGS
jgi:hypothetical protein